MPALDQSSDLFLKPVEGHDDVFAFQYSFGLAPEGKAAPENFSIDADSVTELEDGDLLIEGWAANFEGIDRQGENFIDGAFQRGVKSFLEGQSALCFHHKNDHGIGKVLDLQEVPGKGLKMRARVDKQEPSSPLHYIYQGVKKGSYKGLSVGGYFKRKLTPEGWRISDMDFTEVSITPVAVHPGTTFNVVAGKALENAIDPVEAPEPDADAATLAALSASLDNLSAAFEGKALVKVAGPDDGTAGEFNDTDKAFLSFFLGHARSAEVTCNNEIKNGNDAESIKLAKVVLKYHKELASTVHQISAKAGTAITASSHNHLAY